MIIIQISLIIILIILIGKLTLKQKTNLEDKTRIDNLIKMYNEALSTSKQEIKTNNKLINNLKKEYRHYTK